MAMHLSLGATGLLDAGLGLVGCGSARTQRLQPATRLGPVQADRRPSFRPSSDPAQWRTEVRQVDHGEEQADHCAVMKPGQWWGRMLIAKYFSREILGSGTGGLSNARQH